MIEDFMRSSMLCRQRCGSRTKPALQTRGTGQEKLAQSDAGWKRQSSQHQLHHSDHLRYLWLLMARCPCQRHHYLRLQWAFLRQEWRGTWNRECWCRVQQRCQGLCAARVQILTPDPMPTATRARFFPGEDPIGRRLGLGREGDPGEYEIVGVSADVKYQRLHDQAYPVAHIAVAQQALKD